MKSIQRLSIKNIDLIIVFILSIFLSLPHILDICSGYLNYSGFDSQEFLLWNYSAINGYLPYKDFFYPYGLLFYYRNYNLVFILINFSSLPILFTLTFLFIKKVIKNSYYLYFSMLIFYVFIIIITGLDTFARYGIFLIFSLFFSYIFYSSKKIPKSTLFITGLLLGLVISLIPDLGSYLIVFTVFISIFNEYLKIKKKNFLLFNFFRELMKKLTFIFFGFLIGIIPLLIFLLYLGNVLSFLNYFEEVQNITLVAKTPFFSFIDSPANIFTLSILFFSIFFVFYKLLFSKDKFILSFYFQISLIVDILILEQKSIIRSIDQQITFISLILLMLVFYELIHLLHKSIFFKKTVYPFFLLAIIILYGSNIPPREINIQKIPKAVNLSITNKCFNNNLQSFLFKNTSYIKIVNYLKKQPNFNQKIFSFPTGDSAFYVLLNQKPPYYNAIFEGSSAKNQEQAIKYIQDNNIEFITISTNRSSIQDSVPDYIRQPILFKYIVNNYYPFDKIGDNLILKKNNQSDFFDSKLLQQIPQYRDYLFDVYLYKIPYSEGIYKYGFLSKTTSLIKTNDYKKIESFLKENILSSKNKVLVIIPSLNLISDSIDYVKLQSEDKHAATVFYNSCKKNKACIINLSNIPLFYKDRIISNIIFDHKFKGSVIIYYLKDLSKLW
ncbi:MAG: hypothetical protein M1268_00600 [Patescibacteria group bacterium]|nr:hypothetical protein [Patescibacteria group bacterium]